jgi:hypothetical protein
VGSDKKQKKARIVQLPDATITAIEKEILFLDL